MSNRSNVFEGKGRKLTADEIMRLKKRIEQSVEQTKSDSKVDSVILKKTFNV